MHIAVEGIDGSGKTTVFEALKYACNKVDDFISYPSRSSSHTGSSISYLFDNYDKMTSNQISSIFCTDHIMNKPKKGLITVSERSIISAGVYQMFLNNIKFDELFGSLGFYNWSNGMVSLPDHVIFLDTPPHVVMQRLSKKNKDSIEDSLTIHDLERLSDHYEFLIEQFKIPHSKLSDYESSIEDSIEIVNNLTKEYHEKN